MWYVSIPGGEGTRAARDIYSYSYRYGCPSLEGVELRELGELRMSLAILTDKVVITVALSNRRHRRIFRSMLDKR